MTPSLPRRALLRQLGLAGLALGGAACGPLGRRAGAPTPSPTLQLWTLDLAPRFQPWMEDALAAWSRQRPSGRPMAVRWTDVPWSSVERKLLASVFARTAPDLVNLNPLFAAGLASRGGLLDLNSVLPPDADQAYLPGVWSSGQLEGRQFAIPWYLTTRLTMANGRLLRQAGLAAPPRSWGEVPAYAEAIRRRTGRYALFVTVVPEDSAELLEALVQMGVRLLDDQRQAAFWSPAGRRAFAFWTDLYRRGLLPREVVSQGYRRAIELYQAGDLAQVASGPDFLRNLQTNAPGIAAVTTPHPPLSGPSGATNVAVMNVVVPRNSPLPEAGVDLALFLTNGANQLSFAEAARVLPSSRVALKEMERRLRTATVADRAEALVRDARLLALRSLETARVLVPPTPGLKRLQTILYTQLQRAMLGQAASDDALETAAREWNRYAAARWPSEAGQAPGGEASRAPSG
ncbi:MAG: sugar ABC transporter substrate-binding protein [Cyanobacteriota bacterium]|nr:sugar ABC transporter substrate-binding protein [Cyanobacteriota bacterium]